MDLLQKLGGRKFLMAFAAIGAAIYLEQFGKGLTPTMAGFLVSMVGLFHAANFASTSSFLTNKKGADPVIQDKIDDLHETIKIGFAPEKTDDLRQLLVSINTGVSQAQVLSGQTAQAVLNLSSVLQNLRK